MTMGEFDPNIPVGETEGFQPADPFSPGPTSKPASFFAPNVPVGEPGGFQPAQRFTPAPMPTGEFDPDTALAGPRSKERYGQEHARLGLRLPARLIDLGACAIIGSMVSPEFGQSATTTYNSYGQVVADPSTASAINTFYEFLNFWIFSMILGLVAFAYFTFFESALGWTPAKKLFGLSVHASNRPGSPKPSLKEAALRNRFMLRLTFFLIPYLNILFFIITSTKFAFSIVNSTNGQGKHDVLAHTEVLKGQPI
jgi:hypothetical protein